METSANIYDYISKLKSLAASELIRCGENRQDIQISFEHDPIAKQAIITSVVDSNGSKRILIDNSGYLLAYMTALVLFSQTRDKSIKLINSKNSQVEINKIIYGLNWLRASLIGNSEITGAIDSSIAKLKEPWISCSDIIAVIDQIDSKLYKLKQSSQQHLGSNLVH